MSSATYQYGEIVDVTVHCARVDHHAEGELWVQVPGAKAGSLIPLTGAVSVTLVQPADGPAQPGDVWRDCRGLRWFAFDQRRDIDLDEPDIVLTNGHTSPRTMGMVCRDYAPLTLEYRVPAPVMNGTTCEDITGEDELAEPETDWAQYGWCNCDAAPGEACHQKGQPRQRPHLNRPRVDEVAEVIA